MQPAGGGDWRYPQQQHQQQVASTSQAQQAGSYGHGQPIGFTPGQLSLLRNQIMAFRHIKAGTAVPPEVMAGTKASPLQAGALHAGPRVQPQQLHAQPHLHLQQQQQQPIAVSMAARPVMHTAPGQAYARPHVTGYQGMPQQPARSQPYQVPVQQQQYVRPAAPPAAAQAPRPAAATTLMQQPAPDTLVKPPPQVPPAQLKGALYGLVSSSRAPPVTFGIDMLTQQQRAPPPSLNFNAAEVLRRECGRLVEVAVATRIAQLERLLETEATCPGFVSVDGKPPRGSVMLELRRLRLRGLQVQLREAVEREQAEIMNMREVAYRKFAKNCEATRPSFDKVDRAKPDVVLERVRAVKAWRGAQSERQAAEADARKHRNKHVTRFHERLARQHNKLRDDDRSRRMEALRANDLEAYQELLREQGVQETQGERYAAITKFLNDTDAYLHKLAAKVSNVKLQQESAEAFAKATAEARAMGFTEEEVQAAATQAAKDAAASSELATASQADAGGDAQSRYYSLAHSVEEAVKAQPAMLRGPGNAQLRQYQLVGLQWMVSLFNNRLNGILADEMGLGKTVQVMALLAYLMENKGVYGPHLIIVPNAVIVNWKGELTQWLPDVRCVYYVGSKEERARMYAGEVQSLQFNVLVTTYEYIMRDRAKLSKVEWKYLIIDEAQRMKDRQSKLAKDLDRFTAARRLLLTGTPLQNELRELWSLLNLLLPEVFDDNSTFTEWFGDSLGKAADGGREEEWLETEKRVVVIHRLHQILEPFMLRRQVEDVESKLPPKVTHTIKVAMPPYQAVIYNWIKPSGTRLTDPSTVPPGKPLHRWHNLNNKCMELRKVCNHPALSYPPLYQTPGEQLVAQCGKFLVLDRMLVKLHASGHRVLLFSTMTKLLDLLEMYLRWREVGPRGSGRRMGFLRIDGSTSLEDREKAIRAFNDPAGSAFIFLLSIRAAGRGLNLQSADTVVIYDPDPNPKNEEQAIARSHRIGQTKEVRVFHLEAVADAPAGEGGADGGGGRGQRRYADSIESLVRNSIQQTKIDMANEVIDAGRFDMSTTQEERKETLEALLQDEERMKKAVNEVPTAAQLNRMLARSPQEVDLFDKMDAQADWPLPCTDGSDLPRWLVYSEAELAEAVAQNSKARGNANQQATTAAARDAPAKRRRTAAQPGQYAELDADDEEFAAAPSSLQTGPEPSVSALPDADDMEEVIGAGGNTLPTREDSVAQPLPDSGGGPAWQQQRRREEASSQPAEQEQAAAKRLRLSFKMPGQPGA